MSERIVDWAALPREPRMGSPVTRRQAEIMDRLAGGATQREVARALYVTDATVSTLVRRVRCKLGVSSTSRALLVWRRDRDRWTAR